MGLNWECPFSPFTYPITYKIVLTVLEQSVNLERITSPKYGFGISKVYLIGIQFQIKLVNISLTKDWSDKKINTQIEKNLDS